MDYNKYALGNKLRDLRNRSGISQKQLGAKLGISQSRVGDIESGRHLLRKREHIEKIMDIFNISFDDLFEDVLTAFQTNEEDRLKKQFENELLQTNQLGLDVIEDIINIMIDEIDD